MIEIKNLKYSYNNKDKVLDDVSLNFFPGVKYGIVGHNGAGKSTLLKLIMGMDDKFEGEIVLDGCNIYDFSRKKIAKYISYIGSSIICDFDYTVFDIVAMGRYIYSDFWGKLADNDKYLIYDVLKKVGIYKYKNKLITHLSSGEQQLVYLAKVLVQDAKFIVLDEPFVHLDVKNLINFYKLLNEYSLMKNLGIIIVSHQLLFLNKFVDHLITLNQGKIIYNKKNVSVVNNDKLINSFMKEARLVGL